MAKLNYIVSADVSNAIKNFGSLAKKIEDVNKSVKKNLDAAFGKNAVKFSENLLSKMKYVAAGLAAVSVAAVKMSADFEMTKRSMTVLTGSAAEAKKHLEALEQFGMTTPFEFTNLVDASKRLQAYGFQAQSVIPILNAVGNASMAVGLGKEGIDRVTLAIGQIAAKGKLSAEEMRQLAETGIPAWKMIADHMGISVAELMDKTKKGAVSANVALTGLFEGMQNKFGGMMGKVAQEIPQQLSNMKDAVASIMRSLGAEITDALDLKTKMMGVTTWLTVFASQVKKSGIKEAMAELVPDSVKTGLVVTASVISALLLPALAKLAMAAMAVGGVFTPIIAGIAAGAYLIYENWDNLKTFFSDLLGTIKFFLKTIWIASQNVFDRLNSGIASLIGKIPGLGKLADAYRDLASVGVSPNQSFESLWEERKKQTAERLKANNTNKKTPLTMADAWAKVQKMQKDLTKNLEKSFDPKKTDWSKIFGNSGSGGLTAGNGKTKSGKSAIETFVQSVRDKMKYLGEDGNKFLGILNSWQAKLKPLSEDWKKIEDLKIDIFGENAQKSADLADRVMTRIQKTKDDAKEMAAMYARADSEYLSGLQWENQQGLLPDTQYLDMLKARIEELGIKAKNIFNWTDTDKEVFGAYQSAGTNNLSAQLDTLKNRFESGAISGSMYKANLEQLKIAFADMPLGIKLLDDAIKNLNETMNKFPTAAQQTTAAIYDAQSALHNLPTGIGNAFESAIRGTESLGDAMKNLLQDIGAVIAKALIMRALFGGGAGGGFFGSGGGFFGMLGLKFHEGGTVGSGGSPTMVSPSVFANAPRMHSGGIAGLRSDEVPAILQRGEVVVPKNASQGGASSGAAGDNYSITIQAVDAQSFVKMLQGNKGTIESLIVNGLQRGGALRTAVKGAM